MALKIQDFIDLEQFQLLQDRLNEICSFPSSIIDCDGHILTATAWQDVCTKFHRKNSESRKECIKSDRYIASHLHEANPAVSYRCPHGLIDNAIPIIIEGVHYGNFFTGQFFLEPPDLDFFKAQAKRYGFDEEPYLEAVRKVPIWTEEKLNSYLLFIKGLIDVISGIGLKNLKEMEARRRIQESDDRHRAILQTAMDGIWKTDMQGRLLEVNEAYCRMSGYSAQELMEMRISDLEAVETADKTAAHLRKVAAQGEGRFESRHRRKDGTIFDVEVSVQYRPIEGGQFVAFLRNITEQKHAEMELRESQELFTQYIRHSPIYTYIKEVMPTECRVLYASDNFQEMIGIPGRDMTGRTMAELFPAEFAAKITADDLAVVADGKVLKRNEDLNGRNYITIKFPVVLGEKTLLAGYTIDITEQKRVEEEKLALERQVQQAQKMEGLGVLAGGIAHDFNNILMAILGHAELALEEISPMSAARGNLTEITTAARRASDLCRQMLAYAGKSSFSLERVGMRELVEEMAHLLKTAISKKAILNLNLEQGLPSIQGDPSQIRQVVMNLIINASEAIGDQSGVITVSVGATRCDKEYLRKTELREDLAPGVYVHLEVTDTGSGMNAETRSRIFEPFFSTKFTGRGLGLAAVQGIVRGHKGALKVYSEPGKGTTFKILFPGSDETGTTARTDDSSPLAYWRGKGTILLVDDEESLIALGARMLEHLGLTVLTAADGLQAVDLYRERGKEIDLVLMDLTMPHMDGAEAFGELRRLNPDVRVVLASGYSHEDVRSRFAGKNLDGVLQKPYTVSKLREALAGRMPGTKA
ncbi:MAG: PocR ligand-binding domain-containing protein [Deltaproteobacteria bacterium]|nr:PocR ligand-binding domain-containing protein [Deltaproteobacteria bacterium]